MVENVINDPALKKYWVTFKEGETLFLEGEPSQDLYILVSGHLEILRGNKRISEIKDACVPFGEISFLLDVERTATVKALSDSTCIRIPKDKIESVLNSLVKDGLILQKQNEDIFYVQ